MSDAAVFSEVSNRKVREAMPVPLNGSSPWLLHCGKRVIFLVSYCLYFGCHFVITSNQKARDKEDGLTD